MIVPAQPADEAARLQELHALGILDSNKESLFDDIVKLASFITKCPMSMISLIDTDRQWFKAKLGVDAQQTHRDLSFCGHAIAHDRMFTVEDALSDLRFADNPLVTNAPHIRFYSGRPLTTSNGFRVGTLCTLDHVPRILTKEQLELLESLARQTVFLLERRRNEQTLQSVRRNSQILFDNSPAILLSMQGPEHRLEYTNSTKKNFFNSEKVLGKTFKEAQPESEQSGLLELLDDVYKNSRTRSLQDRPFFVQTQLRHFNLTLTPRFGLDGQVDGVMGILDDITERRQMELELQRLHQQQQLKLNKMSDSLERVPLLVCLLEGPEHRVVFANKLYREQFLQNVVWQGKPLFELFPETVSQGFPALLNNVLATGVPYIAKETYFERHLGDGNIEKYYLNITYEATKDIYGKSVGVLVGVADVTEQVKARSEVLSTIEALHSERELRERFVATLTHDLQSPLTAAKIAAERLRRKPFEFAKVQKLAQSSVAGIDRAEKMVRDLLDANRLKAGGQMPITPSLCSLHTIVEDTAKDLPESIGRCLRLDAPPSPIEGYWDRDGIRRVLENLVGNAAKYGTQGAPIVVRITGHADFAQMSVHNEGPTIEAAELPYLFDSHRRLASAVNSAKQGWGMGLALVKGIAQAHRGQVHVESNEGEGTTFFVQLPYGSRAQPKA